MRGLLLKDFYATRPLFKSLGILLVFYTAVSVISASNSFIMFTTIFIGSSIFFTIFNCDKTGCWDSYVFAMPLSRRLTVISRYIFGGIIIAISMLYGGILFFINILKNTYATDEAAMLLITSVALLTIMMVLLFPLLYHFGVDKGRMIFGALFILLFLVIMAIGKLNMPVDLPLPTISELPSLPLIAGVTTATCALFLLFSLYCSIKIVERKSKR